MHNWNQTVYLASSILFTSCFAGTVMLNSCQTASPRQAEPDIAATSVHEIDGLTKITVPPPYLNLDSFYKKYLDASGIPIIGSENIPDEAFFAVQKVVNKMVSFRPDVLAKLIENKTRIGIMAKTEVTSDMPEYRNVNKEFPGHNWDGDRGTGATIETPLSTCAEENVLCYGEDIDSYFNEDILIHEFAHAMHALGISFIDTGFDEELERAFTNAKANGLWQKTYAGTNSTEYFAEGVQDWFNINAEAVPADGIHGKVNTREELKQYDPVLFNIIKRYFPDDNDNPSCHQ